MSTSDFSVSVTTSDGMLTRATPLIPPGNRARSITVTAKNYAQVRSISVSISPETILTMEYSGTLQVGELNNLYINKEYIRNRESKFWSGWVWKITDTSTWHQIPFELNSKDAVKAPDVFYATIEHLRFILNKELRIRPLVSDAVCVDVGDMLRSSKEVKKTYRGVRATVALHGHEFA